MSEQSVLLLLLILLVSFLGWKTNNLSVSGALGAILAGGAIAYALGWQGLVVLGFFFASSSLWSKYRSRDKSEIEDKLAKTSKRDWQQVLANGGSAMCFSFLYLWTGDSHLMLGALAALAAANADTWASEIGPLSQKSPVSVRTFRKAEKGTSGAISALGTFASLAGGAAIAIVSWILFEEVTVSYLILIAIAGFIGSLVDTLLGAYWQVEYKCGRCQRFTEASVHCGTKADKVKGISIVNNEFVNFSASLFAGTAAVLFVRIF